MPAARIHLPALKQVRHVEKDAGLKEAARKDVAKIVVLAVRQPGRHLLVHRWQAPGHNTAPVHNMVALLTVAQSIMPAHSIMLALNTARLITVKLIVDQAIMACRITVWPITIVTEVFTAASLVIMESMALTT